jgi:hypothetical protein
MVIAEMNTTDGETRWKSSGIGSVQSEIAIARGVHNVAIILTMRIDTANTLIILTPPK